MSDPKLTGFIIGMLLFTFTVIGLTTNLGFIADAYNTELTSEANESFESFDKLQNLSQNAQEIQEQSKIDEKTGLTDIIGGYFSSGYNALKTSAQSINVFEEMKNEAISQLNLGVLAGPLKTLTSSIVVIIIFVGVLLSAIVGRGV